MQPEWEQCWDWEQGLDSSREGLASLSGRCEALTGRHLPLSGPQGPFPAGATSFRQGGPRHS